MIYKLSQHRAISLFEYLLSKLNITIILLNLFQIICVSDIGILLIFLFA